MYWILTMILITSAGSTSVSTSYGSYESCMVAGNTFVQGVQGESTKDEQLKGFFTCTHF